MTKSVAIICVDVFVNWDGQFLYLGTACSTSGSTGGSGGGSSGGFTPGGLGLGYDPGDLWITEPYDAGGTTGTSGGVSSVYNSSTGNYEYKFSLLYKIYGINSTLNLVQKEKLMVVLRNFLNTKTGKMLYDLMIKKNMTIHFAIEPNLKYPALYNGETMKIKIRDIDDLRIMQLGEEVIHAIQHQCYYDNLMTSAIKNYEFEAKVFFDLYDFANGGNANYFPNASNTNPSFVGPYRTWMDDICNNMNGRFTDVNGFNSLCEMWNGYSGTSIFNFQPELLNYIFRKPIPTYPELP